MRRRAFLFLLLAVFCPRAEAHWKRNCALAVALASPALWNAVDPPKALSPAQAAYEERLGGGVAAPAFGAFSAPARIVGGFIGRQFEGHSASSALETTVRNDYGIALGYLGIWLLLGRLDRRYFSIPSAEFRAAVDRALGTQPKKVVILESFPKGDPHHSYQARVLHTLYGTHPDTQYIGFENLAGLVRLLETLSAKNDVDRLELIFHGHPGRAQFADHSKATLAEFEAAMEGKTFRLMAPGGDVVLTSCSLAVRTPRDNAGERLVEFLGRKLLPRGGRVVAAARNITFDRLPPGLPSNVTAAMIHLAGFGNLENLYHLIRGFWRDYADALADAKVFPIAPTETP